MHSEATANDLTTRTYSELTPEAMTKLLTRLKENGQRIMKKRVIVLQEQIKAEAQYCSSVEQEIQTAGAFVEDALKTGALQPEEKAQWLDYFNKLDEDIESVIASYAPPQRDIVVALYNVTTMPGTLAEYRQRLQLHTGMLVVASELVKVYGKEVEFSKKDELMYASKRDRIQQKRALQLKKTRDKLLLAKQVLEETARRLPDAAETLRHDAGITETQTNDDIISFIENL